MSPSKKQIVKNSICLFAFTIIGWSLIATERLGAREWSDVSGNYQFSGDYVASDEDQVIIRADDGDLLMFQLNELAELDQRYVKDEAKDVAKTNPDSVWKLANGETVQGTLMGFGKQKLSVKREDADIEVNGVKFSELPMAYQKIIPYLVASVDEVTIDDREDLEEHLIDLGAGPVEYSIEGIQIQSLEGQVITIPIPMLTKREADQVLPGFMRWKKSQQESEVAGSDSDDASTSDEVSKRERLTLRAQERLRAAKGVDLRKMRAVEIQMLAASAGVTDIWEVFLAPTYRYGYPTSIVVAAENSRGAQLIARKRRPGRQILTVRKLSY